MVIIRMLWRPMIMRSRYSLSKGYIMVDEQMHCGHFSEELNLSPQKG